MANIGSMTATLGVDTKGLTKATSSMKSFTNKASRGFATVTKRVFSLQGAILALAGGYGLKKLVSSFIDASSTVEDYQVRLKALLGSVEEGNKLFEEMAVFAGKVPFELEQIMGAATQLAGIMRGGTSEINQWMPLIGDLAAVSGLSIDKTTEQVVRMYSAGAASADLFRERGITAMLGFTAGVSYSAEETRKTLMEAWKDPASKFRGATEDMAKTWRGTMSMISDKWFQFRRMVMDAGAFDSLKKSLNAINERFGNWIEANRELIEVNVPIYVDRITTAMNNLHKGIVKVIEIYSKFQDFFYGEGLTGDAKGLAKQGLEKQLNLALRSYQLMVEQGNINQETLRSAESRIFTLKQRISILEDEIRIAESTKQLQSVKDSWMLKPASATTTATPTVDLTATQAAAKQQQDWLVEDAMKQADLLRMINERSFDEESSMRAIMFEQEQTLRMQQIEAAQSHADQLRAINNVTLAQRIEAEQVAINQIAKIDAQEVATKKKAINEMLGNAAGFFFEMGKKNKAAFVAFKAISIAETMINTYKAAVGAYSALASIPIVGPVLGIAAAAAAMAYGMAQVSAISSMQPGGAGGGGSGGGGSTGTYSASPYTGLPEETGTEEKGTTYNFYFEGEMVDDKDWMLNFADKLSQAVENNDMVLVASSAKTAEGLS